MAAGQVLGVARRRSGRSSSRPDEVGDPHALDISLELNGERCSPPTRAQFIFDIPTLIATISEFIPLRPGDVVLTGTPSGVGYRRDPKVLLRDGDSRGRRDRERRPAGEPGRRRALSRAAVTVSFDNLGEVTELARGEWPAGEPLGQHFSVTRALPRILALLDELGLRATFFVEGRNTELYPDTLARSTPRGTRSPTTAGATSRGRT